LAKKGPFGMQSGEEKGPKRGAQSVRKATYQKSRRNGGHEGLIGV